MEAFDEEQLEGMEVAEALPDGFEVRRVFAFGFEQYAEDGSIWLQCSLVTKADQNNGALSETEVDDQEKHWIEWAEIEANDLTWEINKYHVKAFYLTEVRDYLEKDIPQIENIQAPGLDNDNEGE